MKDILIVLWQVFGVFFIACLFVMAAPMVLILVVAYADSKKGFLHQLNKEATSIFLWDRRVLK